MSSNSNTRKKCARLGAESDLPDVSDSESTRHKRPRRQSEAAPPYVLAENISCHRREEKISQPVVQSHDGPFSDNDAVVTDRDGMFITSVHVTEVGPGLGHILAGFYTAVRHGSHELRIKNKSSSVNLDVVEWTGSIPIVSLDVYASFEFQPMLGAGESLRNLTVTVKQMLDCSAKKSKQAIAVTMYLSKCFGEHGNLEDSISTLRDAIHFIPDGHPDKPGFLSNFGISLHNRFRRLGERDDLHEAISILRDAVQFTPADHPDKPGCLDSLAIFLLTRFEHLGELYDLDEAVFTHRDAVLLTPPGHPDMPSYLSNLGTSLRIRFSRFGELDDLEEAVSTHRDALQLSSVGHPNRPRLLNNLGNSLHTRFRRLGKLSDLDDAISILKDALQLTSAGHPDKPRRLGDLGNSLCDRFERLGELGDLDDAISTQRDAVQLTPTGHPDQPLGLNSLGHSLHTRFERFGELDDLDDAISTQRDAVRLTPDSHPDKAGFLKNLGISLGTRFERLGELGDLVDAISILSDAVQLTPDGHPARPGCLTSFGFFLYTRFLRCGELDDLDKAISTLRDTVRLVPAGHPDQPFYLNNLGNSLRARFERLGELPDLEDAISIFRNALRFTPVGHPHKPRRLNDLGNSLRNRFSHLGELGDLDDAILTLRDAVQFTPAGHPDKPRHLDSLGNSLRTRFERLGEFCDIDEAISTQRGAVQLTPDGHPNKPEFLKNLGISLGTRFERLGDLGDLDDAVSTQRDAVQFTPDGHPGKPRILDSLGNSLRTRFERLGEFGDIDDTISVHRDAVQLTPAGHPDQPLCLNNFGHSLRTRFERLGKLSDLDDAISAQKDAVQLIPSDNSARLVILNGLGNSLRTRFQCLGEFHDLEGALSAYSHAASASSGSVRTRFDASQNWILCARLIRHHSLLRAYLTALDLLPQLAWIGLSLDHRYSELTQGADLAREAAAAALGAALPELAVEWLERGRSIFWGEQFRLRGFYEDLGYAHPDHARRLRELSVALNHASATREKSLSTLSPGSGGPAPESLRQEADRHRTLAIERDNLLREIRRLPGFDRFLRYTQFSKLRASAHAGPVVFLNAAESRCDALIVLANVDHVVHVPLPEFTFQQLSALLTIVKALIRPDGRSTDWDRPDWETVLHPLWKFVVKPVLDALAYSIPGDPSSSRIFWCPTGPFAFLPFHAAGLYGDEYSQLGHKVFDFVVSSYTPSLATLMPLPHRSAPRSDNIRLLAVCQPVTDGQGRLPGAVIELGHVKEAIEKLPSAHTTLMEPSAGTVDEVLSLMKDADWVHFACHGVEDGLDSGLCLADGRRLKIRDMIWLSRPNGGLAFVSVCHTATGEKRLVDEAIHLAGGMLFAGYLGIIGTMWSSSDSLAPLVARGTYGRLFRGGTPPDHRGAAYALHEAIADLRDGVGASFDEWIPFIHAGL